MQLEEQAFFDAASARQVLQEAFVAANAAVLQKTSKDPSLRGMGTTLMAAIVDRRHLHVGHVGDSRGELTAEEASTPRCAQRSPKLSASI
jgi:serine/threonine protein phosphatase PrpC